MRLLFAYYAGGCFINMPFGFWGSSRVEDPLDRFNYMIDGAKYGGVRAIRGGRPGGNLWLALFFCVIGLIANTTFLLIEYVTMSSSYRLARDLVFEAFLGLLIVAVSFRIIRGDAVRE